VRGYGRSSKPDAVEAYSLPLLAGDVLAILAERQISRAHVVGHDWGAALAWVLASLEPGKVDHLVAMSVGNPVTFLRTLEQRQKSWYMLLFQFPGVAERWLTEDNWANFRTWGCHPDADAVIAELEADGSLTPRPQLVPRQHLPRVICRATAAAPAGASARHGPVEHGRLRPDRSADDRFSRRCVFPRHWTSTACS
jgi:pimeloyl-ACP methyl ester carboxylesterase